MMQPDSIGMESQIIEDEARAQRAQQDKFIVVETNFKVYAYTSSKVYLALFRLFMRVEYAFPNMIVATLTRSNL